MNEPWHVHVTAQDRRITGAVQPKAEPSYADWFNNSMYGYPLPETDQSAATPPCSASQ